MCKKETHIKGGIAAKEGPEIPVDIQNMIPFILGAGPCPPFPDT
jgi:hypothetical protein